MLRTPMILTILSILSTAFVLYVAGINFGTAVALSGFGPVMQVPIGALLLVTYALGLVTIGCAWGTQKRREIKGEQKLVKWEKEDQKLMVELASDEKKLLEAKIATLETALQKALKKKST